MHVGSWGTAFNLIETPWTVQWSIIIVVCDSHLHVCYHLEWNGCRPKETNCFQIRLKCASTNNSSMHGYNESIYNMHDVPLHQQSKIRIEELAVACHWIPNSVQSLCPHWAVSTAMQNRLQPGIFNSKRYNYWIDPFKIAGTPSWG